MGNNVAFCGCNKNDLTNTHEQQVNNSITKNN